MGDNHNLEGLTPIVPKLQKLRKYDFGLHEKNTVDMLYLNAYRVQWAMGQLSFNSLLRQTRFYNFNSVKKISFIHCYLLKTN